MDFAIQMKDNEITTEAWTMNTPLGFVYTNEIHINSFQFPDYIAAQMTLT